MLKQIVAVLAIVLSLSLQSCAAATAGLNTYTDSDDGYAFLYPSSWVPIQVKNGPDVVLHDLIEETENVSVIISPVPDGKTLQELGSPGEVGYKLSKNAIAPANSGRQAELVSAEARETGLNTYYLLEYAVSLPTQKRHNLASVVVDHGKLYTFNLSTTERRWEQSSQLFRSVVDSFSVS